jgi:anti-sigma factor ChrR (cupin superfamily)
MTASDRPHPERLSDYVLGVASAEDRAEIEREMAASQDLRREIDLLTEAMAEAAVSDLAPLPVPPAGRARLLAAIGSGERFAPLVARLASLFDLPAATVRALLDKIDDGAAWIGGFAPGLRFFNFTPGPRHLAAEAGFVRLAPGAIFPRHRHLGHETTLILEGWMRDGDQRFGPGSLIEHEKDSEHGWVNDGPGDLVVVSVHHGLQPL